MALRELPFRTATALSRDARHGLRVGYPLCCRNASSSTTSTTTTTHTTVSQDVETSSSLQVPPPSDELVKGYDPLARSRLRRRGKRELPPSRYVPNTGCRQWTSN
jgi:large subunit ribosomal protein L5